jgi:hypothetical protein
MVKVERTVDWKKYLWRWKEACAGRYILASLFLFRECDGDVLRSLHSSVILLMSKMRLNAFSKHLTSGDDNYPVLCLIFPFCTFHFEAGRMNLNVSCLFF